MKPYILLAATALMLAACTNDEVTTVPDGEAALKVNATISGTNTRASGTDWAHGDRIGITGGNYTNRPYAYESGKFAATGQEIYFEDSNPVTFRAYYPYAEGGGTVTATTGADMQTADQQPKIDFLHAGGATASKGNPVVNFTGEHAFCHRMSQITLEFTEGADMDFDNGMLTGYTLGGLKLQGSFNTQDGTATADDNASAAELTIALSGVTTTNDRYTASPVIVFPQSAIGIDLAVTVNGQTYKAKLTVPEYNSAFGLQPGVNYLFPVIVSKTGLTAGSADIKDWVTVTDDDNTALM